MKDIVWDRVLSVDFDEIDENSVCYTGTHDNDTTLGWYSSLDEHTRACVTEMTGGGEMPAALIETAYRSVANVAAGRLRVEPESQELLDLLEREAEILGPADELTAQPRPGGLGWVLDRVGDVGVVDVLVELVGKTKTLHQFRHDRVVILGVIDRIDDLVAPLDLARRGGDAAGGFVLRGTRQDIGIVLVTHDRCH